jgi:ABC-type lipoprotein release transport system permease subunit
MKLFDVVNMATHNLLQRPVRTALNLVGISLGTIIILLTAAGGEGVRQALYSLIESSPYARRIQVSVDYWQAEEPEPSEYQIAGELDVERRKRLEESLRLEIINRESSYSVGNSIKVANVREIESLDHVDSMVPQIWLSFVLQKNNVQRQFEGEAVAPNARGQMKNLLAGKPLAAGDTNGILIHELVAYHMGYVTKGQVEQLIGQQVTAVFRSGGKSMNNLAYLVNRSVNESDPDKLFQTQSEFLTALKQLVGEMDLSSLTDAQKAMIKSTLDLTEQVEATPEVTESRLFIVRGVYFEKEQNVFDFIERYFREASSLVLFHPEAAIDVGVNVSGQDEFFAASVMVDRFQNLKEVESKIKAMGFETLSVSQVFKNVEEEIQSVCGVIFYIGLAVLAIAAIGISNTLFISVLERTREFGIMKSLGATNWQITRLMLVEGAALGALGAAIALAMSWLAAILGGRFLQGYVEGEVGQTVSGNLFVFSWTSVLIAFAASIIVCSAASILPAWRAARLDPIVAIREN